MYSCIVHSCNACIPEGSCLFLGVRARVIRCVVGGDVGTQYRSALFFTDNGQRRTMLQAVDKHQSDFVDQIVTNIAPLEQYWLAEDYHQQYVCVPGIVTVDNTQLDM